MTERLGLAFGRALLAPLLPLGRRLFVDAFDLGPLGLERNQKRGEAIARILHIGKHLVDALLLPLLLTRELRGRERARGRGGGQGRGRGFGGGRGAGAQARGQTEQCGC